MIIGLIGAENSHARHFCEAINKHKKWEDVSVRYIYGADDPAACKKICDEYGIEECAAEDEVIAKSDAVAITYRKGSAHFEPAMRALQAGKAVFNDKPFATNSDRARELIAFAKANNSLITGGSNLKGIEQIISLREHIKPGSAVMISFAADPESEYDGYWFYGIHSAELCLLLCGEDFTDVTAFNNKGVVAANIAYPDRQCVIVTAPQAYDLIITITNGGKTTCFPIDLNYQDVSAKDLVSMVKTGELPYKLEHHIKSVELMEKIIDSAGLL